MDATLSLFTTKTKLKNSIPIITRNPFANFGRISIFRFQHNRCCSELQRQSEIVNVCIPVCTVCSTDFQITNLKFSKNIGMPSRSWCTLFTSLAHCQIQKAGVIEKAYTVNKSRQNQMKIIVCTQQLWWYLYIDFSCCRFAFLFWLFSLSQLVNC